MFRLYSNNLIHSPNQLPSWQHSCSSNLHFLVTILSPDVKLTTPGACSQLLALKPPPQSAPDTIRISSFCTKTSVHSSHFLLPCTSSPEVPLSPDQRLLVVQAPASPSLPPLEQESSNSVPSSFLDPPQGLLFPDLVSFLPLPLPPYYLSSGSQPLTSPSAFPLLLPCFLHPPLPSLVCHTSHGSRQEGNGETYRLQTSSGRKQDPAPVFVRRQEKEPTWGPIYTPSR